MERTAPQPSCSQAQTNESHSASLLVIGSFNLTTSADQLADQLAQLRRAVDVLPDVGNTVATLVSPLQPPSDATVSPALRYTLRQCSIEASLPFELSSPYYNVMVQFAEEWWYGAGITGH